MHLMHLVAVAVLVGCVPDALAVTCAWTTLTEQTPSYAKQLKDVWFSLHERNQVACIYKVSQYSGSDRLTD